MSILERACTHTARHLHTLAALVSGIVGSRSTNLPAIAGKAPDRTKRESRVKRFSRWMKNERINAQVYFLPYADRCDLSLFQLVLNLLDHFLDEHIHIPVAFQMPRLAESVR